MAYKTQQTKGQRQRKREWESGGDDGAGADHSSPFGTPKCLAASGIYPRLLSPSARLDSTSPGRTCLSLSVSAIINIGINAVACDVGNPGETAGRRGKWRGKRGEAKGAVDNHTKCCHLPFVRFCHLPYRRIFI